MPRDGFGAGEGGEDVDETKHLDAEGFIPHAPVEHFANPELFLEEGGGLPFNHLVEPFSGLLQALFQGGDHGFPPC